MRKFLVLFFVLVASICFAGSQQTSSTSADTIIDNARSYLNDTDSDDYYWSDTELLAHVNSGSKDIASRTRCLEGSQSINLHTSIVEYSIFPPYIDVGTVIYIDADGKRKGLIRKNPQSIGWVGTEAGEPSYWYEWNGKVGVYPALSARTTETITLYTISGATAVSAASSIVIPAIYDKALTLYVAAQAFIKEGAFAKSGRFMAEYQAELDRFRTDFVERPQEPESNIQIVP